MKRFLCMYAITLGVILPALSQQAPPYKTAAPARSEVLVLGVYHMSNPGRDVFNMKADDVLAPKRQEEVAQVIAALKKFNPTKVVVEQEAGDERVLKSYADYVAGKHELTNNETEQLGFRLAKELGQKTIYPEDVEGDFPWHRLTNYAKGSGRAKELEVIEAEIGEMVKAQDMYLHSHTVLDTLLYMNADEKVAEDVGYYYREAAIGEPDDYAGADLLAEWFRRNARIYTNVMQLINSPNERVLVIFGSGHLGWLRHNFTSNPNLRLRKLSEYTK